jgi:hypothetical protein
MSDLDDLFASPPPDLRIPTDLDAVVRRCRAQRVAQAQRAVEAKAAAAAKRSAKRKPPAMPKRPKAD